MVNVPRFARISIVVDGNACEQHYESLGRNTIQLEGHCERRGIKMTINPNRRGFVHRVTLNPLVPCGRSLSRTGPATALTFGNDFPRY